MQHRFNPCGNNRAKGESTQKWGTVKSIRLLLLVASTAVAWSPASFAQRQAAVGPGIIPLSATGSLNGVDMSASGITGTLSVGVVGGPQTDIFTSNAALSSPLQAVSTAASSQGNIVFNSSSNVFGAIGVTQPGGPFLLNISGGNAGTTVNFLGPVFATITTVSGTGTLNFNSGSNNVSATIFAADGTIGLAPNTTVIGALTTTAGANTGTLNLGANSTLDGAVGGAIGLRSINVVGGSNTAGVTASITGAANAFAFSLGTNTLNVGGALTIANSGPGGVINTTLASPSVFGNIRPVGATNLGPSLLVNVTVPSTAIIPVGQIFNIVQTQTGTVQSGTNGTVVNVTVASPTNPLYTFVAVPEAGTVAGLVAIRVTGIPAEVPLVPPPGVPLPPVTPIAIPIATTIIPAALPILAPINALTNPVDVVNALAQLAPSAPAIAAGYVTFENSRQFQNLLLAHLDEVMCSQVRQRRPDEETTACPQPYNGWWLKGFGYWGNQGMVNSFVGYNSSIIGGMMGYDRLLDPGLRAGVAVGYSRTTINGQQFDAQTAFSTYRVTAYGAYEPGNWFLYGEASLGLNAYTGTRHVVFPGFNQSALSSYNGQEYTGSLITGYHFNVQGLTITPLASLQYTHVNLGGYTENTAPEINLAVQSQSYDFLQSGLGVKLAAPFAFDGGTLVPTVHAKWLYMLNNPTLQNTAAFTSGGAQFTTPGLATSNSMFNVGAGLTFLSCGCTAKTWSIEGVYDFYARSDNYFAHAGMLRFTSRF